MEKDKKKSKGYWFIDSQGTIAHAAYFDPKFTYRRQELGNFFWDEKLAYYHLQRLKVWNKLSKWSRPFSEDEPNFYIVYDPHSGEIEVLESDIYHYGALVFDSEEEAKEAILVVGDKDVKKYYLGVE